MNKNKNRGRFVVGLAAVIMSGASPAVAEPEPDTCAEMLEGDVAACEAEAAKACAGASDAWGRRQCERKIAIKNDACQSVELEQARSRKQELYTRAGGSDATANAAKDYFDDDEAGERRWVARVQTVEADAAKYAALHAEWSACKQTFRAHEAEYMSKLPAMYKDAYKHAVDKVLARMKKLEPDPRAKTGTAGSALDRDTEKAAKQLLGMAAKLPASWRYKQGDLEAGLARSAANEAAAAASKARARAAAVQNARCTPGKALAGKYASLAKNLILSNEYEDESKVIKQVYRQTSQVERGRRGLISNEILSASVCRMTSANRCTEIHIQLFREKPPGNPWTSWNARFANADKEFNCKRF